MKSKEDAIRIQQYADRLADHDRFPEAGNDTKREYMASQLFPDQTSDIRSIVALARAIYWWDVEPLERVTKAERVLELRAQGYAIRNIATMVRMPESKVRAALTD